MHKLWLIIPILLIAACTTQQNPSATEAPVYIPIEAVPTIDPENESLHLAQQKYNSFCAHCHGYGGEGQLPDTAIQTREQGYNTVPPHNANGHTWEHPDQLLFETIKHGIENPLNLYPMAEYGSRVSDDEILGIIDYMKIWWTDEQGSYQERLTQEYAERDPQWEEDHLHAEDEAGDSQ